MNKITSKLIQIAAENSRCGYAFFRNIEGMECIVPGRDRMEEAGEEFALIRPNKEVEFQRIKIAQITNIDDIEGWEPF